MGRLLTGPKIKTPFRVRYEDAEAAFQLSSVLREHLLARPVNTSVVLMCVGTDRSTGDALGPLVGSEVTERTDRVQVFGTLDNPVHAVNLEETIQLVARTVLRPHIIAVDACLGQSASVGQITLGHGALQPGAGVHKRLPSVGDLHITGVVNVGGCMEYFVLQNTRLSMVFKMANVIANAVAGAVLEAEAQLRPALAADMRSAERTPISRLHALFRR